MFRNLTGGWPGLRIGTQGVTDMEGSTTVVEKSRPEADLKELLSTEEAPTQQYSVQKRKSLVDLEQLQREGLNHKLQLDSSRKKEEGSKSKNGETPIKLYNELIRNRKGAKESKTYCMKSTVRVGMAREDPCEIAYEIHGEGEKHRILFIMGLCMSKELWEPQVRYFSEQPGFQVCIMDNRGHGESRGTNFYLSTTTFAWDCYELLTHLRWDDVHIVGLSMGGMIAQELSYLIHSLRESNRTSLNLKSLTLSATHAGGAFGYLVPLSGIPCMLRWILSLTPYQKTQHLMPFCYSASFLQENYDTLMEWHLSIYRAVKLRTLFSHLCAVFSHYLTYNRLNAIKQGQFPILILTGTDDKLVRARNSSILASALHTECVVLEGCGHLVNCERAEDFNEILHQHVLKSAHDERTLLRRKIKQSPESEKMKEEEDEDSDEENEEDLQSNKGDTRVATPSRGIRGWMTTFPPSPRGVVGMIWKWVMLLLVGVVSMLSALVTFRGMRTTTDNTSNVQVVPAPITPKPQPIISSPPSPSPSPAVVSEEKVEEKSEVLDDAVDSDKPPSSNPPRQKKEKHSTSQKTQAEPEQNGKEPAAEHSNGYQSDQKKKKRRSRRKGK